MIDVRQLGKSGLIELLKADGGLQQQLFRQARAVRRDHGADEVILRGVIEFSNYCHKNCDYCAMRCRNKAVQRYRLTPEEILSIVAEIKKANVSVAFLQSGQDPNSDDILEEVIPEIKRRFDLEVLLCVGERSEEGYRRFAELGANGYILKFETSDPRLYRQIVHVPPTRRLQCLEWIQQSGLKLGTGNIVGLPNQTLDSLAEDICLALTIQPDYVSSSPFIPNQDTPLEHLPYGDLNITLNTLALLRIALKTCLIPPVSALEKIQPDGQLMGFDAGANVMTINFTPGRYRKKYAIYSKGRFVVSLAHALNTIKRAGLRVRTPAPSTL